MENPCACRFPLDELRFGDLKSACCVATISSHAHPLPCQTSAVALWTGQHGSIAGICAVQNHVTALIRTDEPLYRCHAVVARVECVVPLTIDAGCGLVVV